MRRDAIDLKVEHLASLRRPPLEYSLTARIFFLGMDLVTGSRTTLAKTVLLESLASIPYREWEAHAYARLTRGYRDAEAVRQAREVAGWARNAQDNEYRHLLVISEKMRQDGLREPWYLHGLLPALMIGSYVLLSRLLTRLSAPRSYLFNAEFEDHAEHVYASLVDEHTEWESQQAAGAAVAEYAGQYGGQGREIRTWADVFRRIGLDERDHRNASFALAGRPEAAAEY